MANKRTDVIGGLGYVAEKLGVGFMRSVEGIWDYTAGGIAKLFDNDKWAEEQVMNSWFGDWYEHPDQWYEASDGWRVAGDVFGGIGTSLPSIGLAFVPVAGPALAVGSAALGAAGTSVTDAAKEKGELTNAMFGYGAMTGAFEGLMEYATGGTGGIIKDIAAKTAKESTEAVIRSGAKTLLKKAGADAIQGAVEEGMATFMEPYFARATYDPNAQNASIQEVAYSAFVGALSEAFMGTGYTLGSDAISGSTLVSKGKSGEVLEVGRRLSEFEAKNGTQNEQFELVRSTYDKLMASIEATGGEVTTLSQRMQLGALQRYSTGAVFSPMIIRTAVNIVNNADAVSTRAAQYGYKTADGNSLAFTKEELLKGIKFDKNGKINRKSLGKALANNEALRTLAINQAVGNLIMNNQQFIQGTLSGEAMATQADVNRLLETGSDAEVKAVEDALDIKNWADVDSDELHRRLAAYNGSGRADEYRAAVKQYKAISEEKALNAVPRRINMADGIRRFKDGNADIAIEKKGHDYYIYDYESGYRSRKLSFSEVNDALLRYKKGTEAGSVTDSAAIKENSATNENNSSDRTNDSSAEESPRARERREIDEYCRSNVRDYHKLSAEGQAMVRRVIRNGRAYNIAEAELLSYARVSAHSGLDIFFSRRLTADGSSGYIDPRRNRIVVNPDSVTREGMLLHELDHTVRMYIDKDGVIHTKAYKKAIESSPQTLKDEVEREYKNQNKHLTRKEVNEDETNAYFAQMVFTNKGVLEKLLAPRQSLAGRILEFFREANTAYSDDPKLSKAARDYYRKYKKWFDEMSERNFGMNEYRGTVVMKDKSAKKPKKVKTVVGKSGAADDDTRKSFSSIANSFFGNADMTADEFGGSDYRETEGYKQYFEQCLNNFKNSRGEAFDEKSAEKEISDSIDGIVRVAVAMKRAGYDIYDDARKRGAKDSKNRALFSSLEPNSDYLTSSDISTICDKRINFADIYDGIVAEESKRNVPKGKRFFDNVDNYFYLHKVLADKGLTQPCRQCYVESMRKNLAPMANAFIKLVNEADAGNKGNDQLYSKKGEIKKNNAETREWVRSTLEGEYGVSPDVLTVEMLTTEDGLAQLRLQMPLIYEAFNSFYGQSKPKMPKSATPFRFGELTALLTDNRGNIKTSLVEKINSTGGFRLQSYSNFRIQNFADVLAVIFEAGTLGLKGHAYTKVPAFLDATAGTNLKRNISVFMYNDGGEWKLDRNDSFPYTLDEIYGIVNNDASGNTGIIAVSQNDANSAWIMANPQVGYGIPFHKSGQKMGTVRDTDVKTDDGRVVKGYSDIKDHTKQQTEVWAKATADHKANTKVSKGINIYSFWDFSNQRMSQRNLIIKNLRNYIDACEDAGYLPKFRAYLMNNDAILRKTLEYAKEFGTVGADATVEDISFEYKGYRIPYGYYKFLGDFGMFKPDGKASPQEVLSLKSYDFDYAVDYFSDAETLRRNEILQQFSNGPEREAMRASGMTAEQLEAEVRKRRRAVVDEIADKDIRRSIPLDSLGENGYNVDNENKGGESNAEQRGQNAETLGGREISALGRGGDGIRQQSNDPETVYELLAHREMDLRRDAQKRLGSSGFLEQHKGGHASFADSGGSLLRSLREIKLNGKDRFGRGVPFDVLKHYNNTVFKDENGAVLSVYHWTNANFKTFSIGDVGFHFGTVDAAYRRAMDIRSDYFKQNRTDVPISVFKELYLNITNPVFTKIDACIWTPAATAIALKDDAKVLNADDVEKIENKDGAFATDYNSPAAKELRRILKNRGYDGIVYPNETEGDFSVIALYPDQIHTVSENGVDIDYGDNGGANPDSDIRRSMLLDKLGENGYNGNADDDIRKAFLLLSDTSDKSLTDGQAQYFKDTQIRTEDGIIRAGRGKKHGGAIWLNEVDTSHPADQTYYANAINVLNVGNLRNTVYSKGEKNLASNSVKKFARKLRCSSKDILKIAKGKKCHTVGDLVQCKEFVELCRIRGFDGFEALVGDHRKNEVVEKAFAVFYDSQLRKITVKNPTDSQKIIDNRMRKKYNMIINDVFRPENEILSKAHEYAIRWAKKGDVEVGAEAIFYIEPNARFLVHKIETDDGQEYRVMKFISTEEYNESYYERSRKKQSGTRGVSREVSWFNLVNRRTDTDIDRQPGVDVNATQHVRKGAEIRSLGGDKTGREGKASHNGNRDNEHNGKDQARSGASVSNPDSDIRRSMLLDKLGENGYNGNADDDIRKAFVYDREHYNNFGWAREAGAITKNEIDDLDSAIKQKKLSDFSRSSRGEYIVEVNDKPRTTLDVSNVLVFIKGSSDIPEITRVIRAEIFSNTEMEKYNDIVRRREEGDASAISAYNIYEAIGILREFTRQDFADYSGYLQTKKQGGGQSGLHQGGGANGVGGNGGGSNTGNQQVVSPYIKKVSSFYDVSGRNRNIVRINGKYMVEGQISPKLYDTEKEAIDAENLRVKQRYVRKKDTTLKWLEQKLESDPQFLITERSKKGSKTWDISYDDRRRSFDLDSISSTLDRTQTEKRPEYKGGKREIVSDAMTKASIDFVNEFAGAEKYLRKGGLSQEEAEAVSQFYRSASARADAAVSMYQYDLAGLDSAVNVSGSKKIDRARIRSLRQGEGILPIIDAATAEIVKNHGKDGINKESALHAFSDYMFHRHNIDRMSLEARSRAALAPADLTRLEALEADPNAKKRDIDALKKELGVEENKPVFGEIEGVRGAITAAESRAIVADYEAAFPEFIKHAEKVWQFFRNNMQYQVDTKQMTDADKAYFENKYPHYIPTNRLVKPISISAVRGSGAVAVKNTVKKAVGSGRMLAPLLETATERTLEVYRAGGANRLANAIYDAHMRIGDSDTDVQIVSRYKTSDPDSLVPEKPRRGQITFFRDGEVITMKVTDVIEAAFESQRADTSSFIVNMLATVNSGFKRLVTSMNPTFAISNSVKDAFDGVYNSQHPLEFMFGLVSLSGYREIFRKDRGVLELFYATGGLSSSVYDIQKGFTASRGKRGFQKVRKNKNDGKLKKLAKNVGAAQLANAVENVNQAIEMVPRLVEFKNLLKRGVSPVQAALGAAEVTTNFSRSGRITKKFNRTVIPFLNATVQGSAKLVRNVLGAKGFKGISKLLLTATLAGITPQILNQLLIGALGGELEEEYEELRDSDKMNYFIFPNVITGEGFIRIPKGRIMSAWAGAVVQVTRMKNGLEPEFGEYVEAILSTLTPADSVTRNIFSPFIDLSTNTTWYGGEIEGQQYDNTEPKYRYDEGTSSLAVALGQAINYSPIKIQYLFDQYSGVIGDVIIPLTDSEVDKGMFESKFTVDSSSNNRLSSEFYKLYDEAQYSKTNYSAGRITDDTAVYQLKYLNAVKKEISLLYDQQSAIQTSSLSKVEKMKQLKVVQAMINSLYRTALDDYEKVTSAAMLTANLGYGADDEKERYAEAIRIVYGAERALSQYNEKVYERMKEIHDKTGIDYEALYTYYFATKGLTADKDVNGNTVSGSKKQKVLRVINSLGITQKQKRQLYEMIYG